MIRMVSTISAALISPVKSSFGKSTTTTRRASSARRTRQCRCHDARPDDHARAGVLAVSVVWNPSDPVSNWLAIGRDNLWIRRASDPPFDRKSCTACADADELKARLAHGNWCLGSAFFLDDLCFIEQAGGGDAWLVL